MRITYTARWEDYKPLIVAKYSELLWLSSIMNFSPIWIRPYKYKIIGFSWNTLKATLKGLFIDHRTLLALDKLHQYEQYLSQNKENSIPTLEITNS